MKELDVPTMTEWTLNRMTIKLPTSAYSSPYCSYGAKEIALERTDNKCEQCGKVGPGGLLIGHHIFPIKGLWREFNLFNHPSNITILCPSCHAKIHGNGRYPRNRPSSQ